jgi:hypothetical protein
MCDIKDMFKNTIYTYQKPTLPPPLPPPIMTEEDFEKCEKLFFEETGKLEVMCGIGHEPLTREQAVNPPPGDNPVAYDRTRLQTWLNKPENIYKLNPTTNTSIDEDWIKQNYPSGLHVNYNKVISNDLTLMNH